MTFPRRPGISPRSAAWGICRACSTARRSSLPLASFSSGRRRRRPLRRRYRRAFSWRGRLRCRLRGGSELRCFENDSAAAGICAGDTRFEPVFRGSGQWRVSRRNRGQLDGESFEKSSVRSAETPLDRDHLPPDRVGGGLGASQGISIEVGYDPLEFFASTDPIVRGRLRMAAGGSWQTADNPVDPPRAAKEVLEPDEKVSIRLRQLDREVQRKMTA